MTHVVKYLLFLIKKLHHQSIIQINQRFAKNFISFCLGFQFSFGYFVFAHIFEILPPVWISSTISAIVTQSSEKAIQYAKKKTKRNPTNKPDSIVRSKTTLKTNFLIRANVHLPAFVHRIPIASAMNSNDVESSFVIHNRATDATSDPDCVNTFFLCFFFAPLFLKVASRAKNFVFLFEAKDTRPCGANLSAISLTPWGVDTCNASLYVFVSLSYVKLCKSIRSRIIGTLFPVHNNHHNKKKGRKKKRKQTS